MVIVNGWDTEDKQLKACLIGRTRIAFHHLPIKFQGDFERASAMLKKRFKPASCKIGVKLSFSSAGSRREKVGLNTLITGRQSISRDPG